MRSSVLAIVLLAAGAPAALASDTPGDGATVSSPATVVFGLSGMGIAPAGTEKENTGHHHLTIDRDESGTIPRSCPGR